MYSATHPFDRSETALPSALRFWIQTHLMRSSCGSWWRWTVRTMLRSCLLMVMAAPLTPPSCRRWCRYVCEPFQVNWHENYWFIEYSDNVLYSWYLFCVCASSFVMSFLLLTSFFIASFLYYPSLLLNIWKINDTQKPVLTPFPFSKFSLFLPLEQLNGTGKILLAPFQAFKFPSSEMVQFRGLVTPCFPKCEPVQCQVPSFDGVSRSRFSFGKRKRREVSCGRGGEITAVSMVAIRCISHSWFSTHQMKIHVLNTLLTSC